MITNGMHRSALKRLAVYGTFEKQLYALKHDCERRMTAQACPRCVLRRSVFALVSRGAVGAGAVQRVLISRLPVHAAARSATETNGASGRRPDKTHPRVAAAADCAARLVECFTVLRCAPQQPFPAATVLWRPSAVATKPSHVSRVVVAAACRPDDCAEAATLMAAAQAIARQCATCTTCVITPPASRARFLLAHPHLRLTDVPSSCRFMSAATVP